MTGRAVPAPQVGARRDILTGLRLCSGHYNRASARLCYLGSPEAGRVGASVREQAR
jgi:hypothetical protein